ncbi:hypothetical protein [Frateuria sp. Soil773]|uniref:hypothetical protein n=1 Tax=Frateuria sp. Soil773 TaxID=1736407 RepID=UPI0012F9DE34|nr:hypothetical protein [Frateuria sp. Soil773]
MSDKVQIAFRVEGGLLEKVRATLPVGESVSKFVISSMEGFVSGKKAFIPEKFGALSAVKDKRVSIKIERALHDKVAVKAHQFGGVSGLVRAIFRSVS